MKAWDERFTHIDESHFRRGERVEDWWPMDGEVPKGVLDAGGGDGGEESEGEGVEEEGRSDLEGSGSDVDDDSAPTINGPRGKATMPGVAKAKTKVSTDAEKAIEPAPAPSSKNPRPNHTTELVWNCVSLSLPSFLSPTFTPPPIHT